jgi:8-oxo-dGTP pyrophosphatase MutT (NUDIX family)
MRPQPLYRRLLGRRLLRLGYRVASVAADAAWSVLGSHNRGVKCVLFNDGDVLLVRHTYGDRKAWDFPGGFVRRREEPLAAARRELGEELGVESPELRPLGSVVVEIGRRRDTVHYLHGDLADRRLWPDDVELAQLAWFDPGSLPRPLGDRVARVLESVASSESLASLETDPGSPIRG